MTFAPKRPCKKPGCSALVEVGEGTYCPGHRRASPLTAARTLTDRHRGSAASRGYDHRWQRARADFLARYPLCPGVLMPTEAWTIELAIEFHHERGRRQALGELLWLSTFDLRLSPYSFKPWDVARPATIVDHIIPHKGDPLLMWSEWNWQPLTKRAHDKKTGTEKGDWPEELHVRQWPGFPASRLPPPASPTSEVSS